MAKFTKTMSGDSRYSIELEVKETSTSGNESIVSYTLKAIKSSGSGFYTSNSNNPVKVTLDGEDVVDKKVSYDFRNKTSITLASGTKPIEHNPDGTKTLTCKGYFKDANNSLGNATASGNLELTALHKPPVPTITSVSENNSVLTGYGITGNHFVAYLSKKSFVVDATKYDGVSITNYTITNGSVSGSSSSSPVALNFLNNGVGYPLITQGIYARFEITATDSMGSIGTRNYNFSNKTLYYPATIVNSNFTTKRAGQLTGNVKLKANGSFYNGSVGSQAVSPKVYYRYKNKNTSTWGNWVDASSSLQKSGGSWSLELNLSGFSYQSTFDFQLKATDNVAEACSLNPATATSVVPTGEPTWTEYKDHVDFKKLTINKKQILAPYTLYDNSSGTITNVTLSDNISNYSFIEVYYKFLDTDSICCQKVCSPNGNKFQINANYDNGTRLYIENAVFSASGTTLTRTSSTRWRFGVGENSTRTNTTSSGSSLNVFKVIGYK